MPHLSLLQAAIDAIDALVLKLQSGQLNAAGVGPGRRAEPLAACAHAWGGWTRSAGLAPHHHLLSSAASPAGQPARPAAAPLAVAPAAKSGKPAKAKPEKPAKAAAPAPAAALDPATEQFQKAHLVVSFWPGAEGVVGRGRWEQAGLAEEGV